MESPAEDELASCLRSAPYLHTPALLLLKLPVTLLTITDRLYLASYVQAPTATTYFPYPDTPGRGSPSKRSQVPGDGPAPHPPRSDREPPCYFSVDDILLYNAFHHDFGPLHIGHLYRFALQFHEVLGAKENQRRPIVFWSRADPRSERSSGFLACGARDAWLLTRGGRI